MGKKKKKKIDPAKEAQDKIDRKAKYRLDKYLKRNPNLSQYQRERKEQMLARRVQVSKLMLKGYNDVEMAEMLDTSATTIGTDRAWVEKAWLEDAIGNIEAARQQAIKRKEVVLRESIEAWEKSKMIQRTKKEKVKDEGGESEDDKSVETTETQKQTPGDPRYLREYSQAIDDIAALQGVDKTGTRDFLDIDMTLPDLPEEYDKYGLNPNKEVPEDVEDAQIIEDDEDEYEYDQDEETDESEAD